MKKLIFLLLPCLLLISSCKKDDDKNKTELLTQKPWIMTGLTYNPAVPVELQGGGTVLVTDYYEYISECFKDNQYIFMQSGTYKYTYGSDRCGTEPDILELGNWAFNSSEIKLSYGILDLITEYDVIALTEDNLTLSTQFYLDSLETQICTETTYFKHP